jgi:hypothetical protein
MIPDKNGRIIEKNLFIMSTINERMKIILDKMFKGNVSEFARKSGIPQPTLNNIVGNRLSKPSADNLAKMIDSIELINIEWVLTGKGEMLKHVPEKEEVPTEAAVISDRVINLLLDRQDGLARENERLKNENKALKKEVSDLKSHVSKRADIRDYPELGYAMPGVAESEIGYERNNLT